MRFLYVTTIGLTMIFFKDLVKKLVDDGNTVDIACNEYEYKVDEFYRELGCNVYQINCSRSPFSKGNLEAIKELKKIISDNKYDIVHCHTPVAGACTRIACKGFRKKGLKVFYTAHGFHFYKGAPLINWLIYYPIEKYCSKFTDTLITINHEDESLAKKRMKAKKVEYVPGVGIDVDKFANAVVDRAEKRQELGIPEDAILILSVGELNKNKNHQIVIRALAELNDKNVHYMIAGEGALSDYLKNLSYELGVESQVHILGYREDTEQLYKIADINAFPSIREGLGLAAIEGMAAGLPLICLDNRGTRNYAKNNVNAFIISNLYGCADAIYKLKSYSTRKSFGESGMITAKNFDVDIINKKMLEIYYR
ncbi:MAG: glycosyltransferase family 4 protein [Clostridia bacterium]|nr:glycosyltransferase family 4 protein [Clostridia bacterium]